jgi:SAM-dependent methyltransferase
MQALIEKLVDPCDKSRVWRDGDWILSQRSSYSCATGYPNMMPEAHEIERHFGKRNYRAWRALQVEAEASYAVRTEGHFSVDHYQPARDFGKLLARFSGEWLDVGCGKLTKPAYMKDAHSINFFGIDPMPLTAQREFPFVQGMGDFLPFNHATFDGVMFASSLDHCIVPLQALEEARRVLKADGTLLVWETIRPDDEHFKEWAAAAIYFQNRYNKRHNWGFTRKSLEFVVTKAGFDILNWAETSDPAEAVLLARPSECR